MRKRAWIGRLAMAGGAMLVVPHAAMAYVGPGGGLSALGALLAVAAAVLLAILGFIWYPLKRLLRAWRGKRSGRCD